jgi:hypothetical protein
MGIDSNRWVPVGCKIKPSEVDQNHLRRICKKGTFDDFPYPQNRDGEVFTTLKCKRLSPYIATRTSSKRQRDDNEQEPPGKRHKTEAQASRANDEYDQTVDRLRRARDHYRKEAGKYAKAIQETKECLGELVIEHKELLKRHNKLQKTYNSLRQDSAAMAAKTFGKAPGTTIDVGTDFGGKPMKTADDSDDGIPRGKGSRSKDIEAFSKRDVGSGIQSGSDSAAIEDSDDSMVYVKQKTRKTVTETGKPKAFNKARL